MEKGKREGREELHIEKECSKWRKFVSDYDIREEIICAFDPTNNNKKKNFQTKLIMYTNAVKKT